MISFTAQITVCHFIPKFTLSENTRRWPHFTVLFLPCDAATIFPSEHKNAIFSNFPSNFNSRIGVLFELLTPDGAKSLFNTKCTFWCNQSVGYFVREELMWGRAVLSIECMSQGEIVFHCRGWHGDFLLCSSFPTSFLTFRRICAARWCCYSVRSTAIGQLSWHPRPHPGVRSHTTVAPATFYAWTNTHSK